LLGTGRTVLGYDEQNEGVGPSVGNPLGKVHVEDREWD
jgi:hypothetical protein